MPRRPHRVEDSPLRPETPLALPPPPSPRTARSLLLRIKTLSGEADAPPLGPAPSPGSYPKEPRRTHWVRPNTIRPLSPAAFARPLRRCPGCHCLTLLHVPIDVYLAMGGSPRARAT